MLVPVLVLLTVFVLWAGRGGRAALTADLAAEEAATAAALCCEEDTAGEPDRETLVEDMLAARPGLGFLCIGGARPEAPADGGGPDEFVQERWLDFEFGSGSRSGGVGVLDVQFGCETDGAVAPLRGLFPTVDFSGQASEVIIRRPQSPDIGFAATVFRVNENASELVFEVRSPIPVPQNIQVDYVISTAVPATVSHTLTSPGSVIMTAGTASVAIRAPLLSEADTLHEGTETLTVELVQLWDPLLSTVLSPTIAELDPDFMIATGEVEDDDPPPHLFLFTTTPCTVTEGDPVPFQVRLRDQANTSPAASASTVRVDVVTSDGTATEPSDYNLVNTTLTFTPGDHTLPVPPLDVQTLDESPPVGEPTETFNVALSNPSGAPLGSVADVDCDIEDDEVRVTVADVAVEEGEQLTFSLSLDRDPSADIAVNYRLVDYRAALLFPNDAPHPAVRGAAPSCAAGDDYLALTGTAVITAPYNSSVPFDLPPVTTCEDALVEHAETFWLETSIPNCPTITPTCPVHGGEAWVDPSDDGAVGTILNDDIVVVSLTPLPDPPTGTEGQATPLEFTASLQGQDLAGTPQPVELIHDITVDYTIAGSGADAATDPAADPPQSGADYAMSLDSATPPELSGTTLEGTLRFTAGPPAVTSHVFEAELLADHLPEVDETFVVDLHNLNDPTGAAVFEDRDSDPNTDDSHIEATIEDDPPPQLSVAGFTGPEGTDQNFVVTLSDPRAGETVEVDYAIAGAGANPATDPAAGETLHDYTAASGSLTGTLTFLPGDTQQLVGVSLLHDLSVEANETLRLMLSNARQAVLADSDPLTPGDQPYGEGTIEEVLPPVLLPGDFTGPEGTDQNFVVTLDGPRAGETVEVDYAIAGAGANPATDPAAGETLHDYTAASGSLTGTLTFLPGDTQQFVGVSLRLDSTVEDDETLRLTLSNASGALLSDRDGSTLGIQAYGEGTIIDADGPQLFVDNPSAREGETLTFTVRLCNPVAGQTVTVDYQTRAHSAVAGRDFDHTSGTLTFSDDATDSNYVTTDLGVTSGCGPGVTADAKSLTVDVTTLNDGIEESDEEVHLVLSNQTPIPQVGFGNAVGVGRIINVSAPTVRVTSPRADEGDPLEFVITLEDNDGNPAVITEDVTVRYRTANRTAAAGSACGNPGVDYVRSGTNSFTFRDTDNIRDVAVTVQTCLDTDDEEDETLALELRVIAGTANLGDAEGTGTIVNQPPPYMRIDDPAAVREGENVTFTVSLYDDDDQPTSTTRPVSVEYTTLDRTATERLDYLPEAGTLTFDPGDMQHTFTVTTLTDNVWEPQETFRVDLSRPVNTVLDKAVGTGTIRADCVDINVDDADNQPPTITVQDEQGPESALRTVGWLTLSRPLCDSFSFTVTFVQGTTGSPATEDDFDVTPSPFDGSRGGRVHPAELSEQLLFAENHPFTGGMFGPLDDTLDEDDEYFYMDVTWSASMPAHYQNLTPARATITIIDDDDPPILRISDAAAEAGDTLTFEVTLDTASGRTVEVDYEIFDGTAAAGSDFSPVPPTALSGTLVFDPGETTKTLDIQTALNMPGEPDETLWVELTSPAHAGIGDSIAVGTILAGAGPTLTIFDDAADEGDVMQFRVTLSEAFPQGVTVDYATVQRTTGDNVADEGTDYQPVSDTLTFAPGATEEFISVVINTDSDDEPDETFLVALSNQTPGVSLADPSAVGTINGNVDCVDRSTTSSQPMPTPRLTVTGTDETRISAREDAGQMPITITLSRPFCQDYDFRVQVWWGNSQDRTATINVDYAAPADPRLPALHPAVDFYVPLIDDDLVEGDEDFQMRIWSGSTPGIRNLGQIYRYPVIVDDDVATLQLPAAGETSTDEGGVLSFVVRLDKPSVNPVTFTYATADGAAPAATAGSDYTPVDGTATIPAGALSVTVAVRTIEDSIDEDDENVELVISNPTGAEPDPGGDTSVGVITDDDDPPEARVSDASTDEGGTLEFAVTLNTPSQRTVSIPVATRDGTATAADGDYVTLLSTHVVLGPGVTRRTVAVQTLADGAVEAGETLWLDLGPMDNDTATIDKALGRGVIRDTSDRRVSVSDAAVVEGGTLAFEVGFSEGPSSQDVTVEYRTRAGTATAGDDYDDDFEAATQQLRIIAGATSATVLVPTAQDRLDEDNETLELELSSPNGAVIIDGTASGVIIDNDPEPALRVGDAEATENGDGTPITFTLSLSEASGRDVQVAYRTDDDTATAGSDYTAAAPGATATITVGNTTATVDVALVDDDVEEDVETFRLEVTGAANAQRDDSVGVGTIIDDDGPIQIIVDDAADVYEGAGASAVFTVRLSRADPDNPVTVMYSTVDGTATAGADYTAASSQTLTFTAGSTAETVTVPLIDDDVIEDPETFRLVLSLPSSNAEIGDGEATVLILDDDALPALTAADAAAATEGSTVTFTIALSRPVTQAVTFDYAAVPDPTAAAETAATVGLDYTATAGTATIAARAASTTVTVPLLDDSFDENTETFWLRITSPTGATIVDGTATATINDDDPLPAVSVSDAGATEGSTLSFEVLLDAVSGRTVTVPWTTEARPAGADAASPGVDYTTVSGTVTFVPGATTARIEVASLPDDIAEDDETFWVQLGTPVNAALDDATAVGAIRDDDGEPRISISDTTVDENDGPAVFAVTLSHPSSRPVTVEYDTDDESATECAAIDELEYCDYAPDQARTITFAAASTEGEISVFIHDDNEPEDTETFTITLTDPVNAVIAEGAGTATGTILDDEGTPRLTVSDAQECEDGSSLADCEVRACRTAQATGYTSEDHYLTCSALLADPAACQAGACGGDGILEFAVQLSHASTEATSVRYSTFPSSAASPRDYVAATGTLTIPAGDTTASIPVTLVDDGVFEQPTETFRLVLDNPEGVELVTEQVTGTIRDDELAPRVSAEPFDQLLANENDGFAYHRLTLSGPSDLTGTVDYYFDWVDDRSGLPSLDDTPGTITFAPGVLEQNIEVPLYDNNVSTDTPSRTHRYANAFYRIELSDFVNLTGWITTGPGVVWDDETPPYVDSVAAQDVLEGAGSATFTITLNRFSDSAVTATYRTSDGTAIAGSDYTATEDTVTFPAGALTAEVTVPILDDTDIESDETFTLSIIDDPRNTNLTYLANPIESGQHGIGSTTVTIIDDDTAPIVSVADTSANENAGTMPFWVSLSRASATDVTVRYATADVTATAGSDYTAADSTLTIDAGATGAAVNVEILDDSDNTEPDETFTLTLSNASGAHISTIDDTATGTIIEDSDLPTITIADSSRSERLTLYSRHLRLRASVSEPPTRDVYFDWEAVEVPSLGDEAATIGADFFATREGTNRPTSISTGEARITVGQEGTSLAFEIVADVIPERDERFLVILSNVRGALIEDDRAWGTIENDDLPIVSVADAQASESDAAVVFDLQLHAPGLDPASLAYTTVVRSSEGDRAASPGEDYTTATGTIDIPAGATTATISVPIIADTADEEDETFLLVLTTPNNLEFRDTVAVGTIVDDDDGYWIRDRSVWENAGTMDITVQRDHTDTGPVTVNYSIGTGGSAVGGTACTDAGGDYIADYVTPSGTVTMAATATTATISIEICDDDEAEGRENLLVELTGVNGRQTIAVGTIVDDDRTDLPRINISDAPSSTETLLATLGAQFQISADGPLTDTVTVSWRTEDCLATDTHCPDPATAGDDYVAVSGGTVTLTPDDTAATATVTVLNDTTDEADTEQFFVRITAVAGPAVVGSGATHTDPVGIGRITDDDEPVCIDTTQPPDTANPPTLAINAPASVTEGETLTVSVTVSPAFCDLKHLGFNTSHQLSYSSPTQPRIDSGDLSGDSHQGGLEFVAGATSSRTFSYEVVDDDDAEGTEYFDFAVAFCGSAEGATYLPCSFHSRPHWSFHPDWGTYVNRSVEVTIAIIDND